MYAHTHLSPAAPTLHPNSHPHAAAYINTGTDELVESSRWFPRVRVKEITPSKDMQKKDKEERWQSESWRTQLIFSEHNDVISKLDRLKKKKKNTDLASAHLVAEVTLRVEDRSTLPWVTVRGRTSYKQW